MPMLVKLQRQKRFCPVKLMSHTGWPLAQHQLHLWQNSCHSAGNNKYNPMLCLALFSEAEVVSCLLFLEFLDQLILQ